MALQAGITMKSRVDGIEFDGDPAALPLEAIAWWCEAEVRLNGVMARTRSGSTHASGLSLTCISPVSPLIWGASHDEAGSRRWLTGRPNGAETDRLRQDSTGRRCGGEAATVHAVRPPVRGRRFVCEEQRCGAR